MPGPSRNFGSFIRLTSFVMEKPIYVSAHQISLVDPNPEGCEITVDGQRIKVTEDAFEVVQIVNRSRAKASRDYE